MHAEFFIVLLAVETESDGNPAPVDEVQTQL